MFAKLLSFNFIIIISIALIIPLDAAVMPQCTPPNNCSVHIFRVRLSQKPDIDEPENATIVSVVQRKKYGSNYFEIKGASEMGEKLTKEIMQNMPENADPRLMEKISKQDFYLKPVGPYEERILTATIPPEVPTRHQNRHHESQQTTNSPEHHSANGNEFPSLLVVLILCIGIVLGILCTGLAIFMADIRKEPTFDRSNAITYKKPTKSINTSTREAERRPMLLRHGGNDIEMMAAIPSTTLSHASTSRLAHSNWRNDSTKRHNAPSSRQISL